MNPSAEGPGPSGTRRRVEELAAANRWEEIYALLGDREWDEVVRDTTLAYRFGQSLYYTGRLGELSDFVPALEGSARESADPVVIMRALLLAGAAAFEQGEVEKARSRFDTLMELAEGEGDEEMQANAANNLGAVAALHGRVHESLSYYRLAAPLYERLNRPRGLAQMHHNIGIAYRDLERLDDARDSYRRAAVLAESIGHESQVALSTVGRAEVELRRGDAALARELAQRGLEEARRVGDPLSEADALRVRGLVRADDPGRLEGALEDLEEARGLAASMGNRFLEAEIERDMGRVLADLGREEEARDALRAAAESFESLGAALEAERARERLGELR